ncbi:hypothetical protein F5I97DRAFT_2056108 [Phlebopus sp. FC_14]|nr:hypothetical protein F5I97DRAFT_2056108 [Phlebopus sp. FC_14]
MSLAVFEISGCVENGVEDIPRMSMGDGTVFHPELFHCGIMPRSAKAEALTRG